MLRTASFWGVCTHPGDRVKRPRASRVEPLYDGTVSLEERALAGLWPWEPITPRDVAEVLAGFQAPWWIAGGSAIELFLGRTTRRRYDLDLAILRRDQLALRRHLADWDLHLATPERRLYPWDGRFLELPVARFWVRRKPGTPWWLDGRLEEARGERWFYRLDERSRSPSPSSAERPTREFRSSRPRSRSSTCSSVRRPRRRPTSSPPTRSWAQQAARGSSRRSQRAAPAIRFCLCLNDSGEPKFPRYSDSA